MSLLKNGSAVILWQDMLKSAEDRCSIRLDEDLESYLISLLIRYSNRPEVAQEVFATRFLEAFHAGIHQRLLLLQRVGDQCLLFAGLFPHVAEKRHVKLKYFVDLGRTAYTSVSDKEHDLYWSLAFQFVALMDILQSIRAHSDLLPLEAYDQWNELGSKRAFKMLQEYSKGIPFKIIKE